MNSSKSSFMRRWLVVGSLVAFAFALCVVGARTQAMGPKTVTVTITPGTPPTVSPDPVEISKSAGDEVTWECPDCKAGFAVHFPKKSPFASHSYSNKSPKSGKASAKAAVGTYHYTVTVNGHTADPGVKLNP
jgi:plastocyanin